MQHNDVTHIHISEPLSGTRVTYPITSQTIIEEVERPAQTVENFPYMAVYVGLMLAGILALAITCAVQERKYRRRSDRQYNTWRSSLCYQVDTVG